MPQFERNYEALGVDFRDALPEFTQAEYLDEERTAALSNLFDDVLTREQVGKLVEFAATYFASDDAKNALAVSQADRQAAWTMGKLLGYQFGKAQLFGTGYAVYFSPYSDYDIAKRAFVVEQVGNRYHLFHEGRHYGVCNRVAPNGHRTIAAFLYGDSTGEGAAEQAERWVRTGPDVEFWKLGDFVVPVRRPVQNGQG